MHYCPTCGHHHGQGPGWVKCMAITTTETGGARRCCCSGPHHHTNEPGLPQARNR